MRSIKSRFQRVEGKVNAYCTADILSDVFNSFTVPAACVEELNGVEVQHAMKTPPAQMNRPKTHYESY